MAECVVPIEVRQHLSNFTELAPMFFTGDGASVYL